MGTVLLCHHGSGKPGYPELQHTLAVFITNPYDVTLYCNTSVCTRKGNFSRNPYSYTLTDGMFQISHASKMTYAATCLVIKVEHNGYFIGYLSYFLFCLFVTISSLFQESVVSCIN